MRLFNVTTLLACFVFVASGDFGFAQGPRGEQNSFGRSNKNFRTVFGQQLAQDQPVIGQPVAPENDPIPIEVVPEDPGQPAGPPIDDSHIEPIGNLTADVSIPEGRLPDNHADSVFKRSGHETHVMGFSRPWGTSDYMWVASQLQNRPLYFEDANLERYGYHWGIAQPAISAAHFFTRVPAIPYMRGAKNPREPVYSLGYYRPGSYAPYYLSRPPVSAKGALYEAGAAVGGVFIVP